ncbi:hypothetical protein CIW82_18280 (plasmid) [Acetobacter tropicalis]|uniref:Uncharacterized protein n=1 Tax=Acetobacter tropicalis TaxID=104102 RepID=A0A291PN43_9PROT|nr:hypothetical protein CIW82_18280 [Acetobacter tropicalis]
MASTYHLRRTLRAGDLLSFCPSVLLSFCPSVLLSFCPSVLLSFCPSVLLSFCQLTGVNSQRNAR